VKIMHLRSLGPLRYFTFDLFDRYENVTCISITRAGGVSTGRFDSLNLGMGGGDDPAAVRDNRAQLSLLTGAFPDLLTLGRQVHGCNVSVVTGATIGSGALDAGTAIPETDALVTGIPDVPLLVLIADCCPVFVFDPVNGAIGLAHAGWRGTAAGIAAATVRMMAQEFGSRAGDIIGGVGPSIGPCCYEVGGEVLDSFRAAYPGFVDRVFAKAGEKKYEFDLQQANRWILKDAGVRDENIEISGLCTSCRTDLFFSHRAEKGKTGRSGALIMLHERTRRAY
jgi:YfiH family protein